ncbi:MAG: FHA domain-containing protein [Planctomycetes bacterium]|jgi:pSer/pThr/pTyr-binding forkhead associated (FHA) protein|nr:FHA domain-containing protein [Planctomycetota bacterium]
MRAQLVPLEGGSPVEVAKEMTVIGRQEDCDIRLDHKSVSKMHCILVKTDGLIVLRDLGSTNGTRVNGTRVRRAAMLPNDKLSVAQFHFRVLFGAALTAAEQSDKTQRVDPAELQQVTGKPAEDVLMDSSADQPMPEVYRNVLPDVYPEDRKK